MLAHLRNVLPLDGGDRRAIVAERDVAVDLCVIIERVRRAGLEIGNEQTVAVAYRGTDGITQEVSLSIEGGVIDAAEEEGVTRDQVVEHRVGAFAVWRAAAESSAA